jgi:hypothetical protein
VVGVVDAVVVPAAEQHTVVDVGGPAVGPMSNLVGVAPAGWGVAPGPDAVPVTGDDRAQLRGGEGAGGAAGVEELRRRPHHDPGDGGVAGEPSRPLGAGGGAE